MSYIYIYNPEHTTNKKIYIYDSILPGSEQHWLVGFRKVRSSFRAMPSAAVVRRFRQLEPRKVQLNVQDFGAIVSHLIEFMGVQSSHPQVTSASI